MRRWGGDEAQVPSAEGAQLLSQATVIAARVISQKKTEVSQGKTEAAQQITTEAEKVRARAVAGATATALSVWTAQQELNNHATAQAIALAAADARQNASATSDANHTAATGTARAEAAERTATTEAHGATVEAVRLQKKIDRANATATVIALIQRAQQDKADDARTEQWKEFFDSLLKIVFGFGSLTFLFMLLVQVTRYLDMLARRPKVLETREGTIAMTPGRGGYTIEVLKRVPNLLEQGDETEFAESEVPAAGSIPVKTMTGTTWLAREDPAEVERDVTRRLTLRLLRESIRYYSAMGYGAGDVNRIASQRALNWSPETWVRAVAALKESGAVTTKPGRGGGTLCAATYPNLKDLYVAIGERRLDLPSPTAQELAA